MTVSPFPQENIWHGHKEWNSSE